MAARRTRVHSQYSIFSLQLVAIGKVNALLSISVEVTSIKDPWKNSKLKRSQLRLGLTHPQCPQGHTLERSGGGVGVCRLSQSGPMRRLSGIRQSKTKNTL